MISAQPRRSLQRRATGRRGPRRRPPRGKPYAASIDDPPNLLQRLIGLQEGTSDGDDTETERD
jgi:hypothetical protein